MKLTLGGKKVETADPKEARDKVVQFLTGNDDATMDNVDETTKRKAAIVMSLMHQGSLGSILTGVNNAFDPTAKMMQINVNEAGGYGGKQENSFSLSKDDKGNLSISGQVVFSGRLMLNLGRIDNNPKIKLTGTDGSLATYSGKISLSAADLDKLAKADWSKLDMQSILAVDLNQKIDDRFQKAADMIPDDFKFTGSVDVNFNIHADSLIDLRELT